MLSPNMDVSSPGVSIPSSLQGMFWGGGAGCRESEWNTGAASPWASRSHPGSKGRAVPGRLSSTEKQESLKTKQKILLFSSPMECLEDTSRDQLLHPFLCLPAPSPLLLKRKSMLLFLYDNSVLEQVDSTQQKC